MLFSNFMTSIHAYSDEISADFSVAPLYSEHQSQGVNNFYDIVWTPSYEEEFAVKITNNTDEVQSYTMNVNKARTNKNGIIDYSDSSPESEDIKYKLTEMVKIDKEVTLDANSSKIIEGKITFPDVDFDGILMAGIYISQMNDSVNESTISSLISYNIPFIVRGNIDTRPDPNLTFTALKVEKDSSDTAILNVNLDNKGPNLLKSVSVLTEIVDEDGKSVFNQEGTIDITPETSFSYPIEIPSTIESGKYNMIFTIRHSEENVWIFEETFDISEEYVNDSLPIKQDQRISTYILLIGITILLIILIVIVKKRFLDKK